MSAVEKHVPAARGPSAPPAPADAAPLVRATDLAKTFDVSAPWLNRVLERQPRQLLRAVDGVSFDIARGETLALVGLRLNRPVASYRVALAAIIARPLVILVMI